MHEKDEECYVELKQTILGKFSFAKAGTQHNRSLNIKLELQNHTTIFRLSVLGSTC